MNDIEAPVTAAAAERLIALRRSQRRQPFAAGELAQTLDEAYNTSARIVADTGGRAAAWKLGGVTPGMRSAFGATDVCYGPILASEMGIAGSGTLPPKPPVFQAEAEIALRMAVDVDGEAALNALQGTQIFDSWTFALEAPYSVVENQPDAGLTALLSDRCAAGALYLAPPRSIDVEYEDAPLQIVEDGTVRAEGCVSTSMLMSPQEAAWRFLKLAVSHGRKVLRGDWISTGGATACIGLDPTLKVELRHGGQTVLTLEPSPQGETAA